jgi:hypothetical protein
VLKKGLLPTPEIGENPLAFRSAGFVLRVKGLAPKIIKLVAALVLFAICMGFRSDVSESWLRMLLAAIASGLMAWGVLQIFFKSR